MVSEWVLVYVQLSMCVWFQALHVTRGPQAAKSTTFNSISAMHN